MGPPVVTRRWSAAQVKEGIADDVGAPARRRAADASASQAGARVVSQLARARLAAAGGRGRLRGRPAAVQLPDPAARRRRHAAHRGRRARRHEPAVAAQHQEGRQGRASRSRHGDAAADLEAFHDLYVAHRRARPLHAAAAVLLRDHVRGAAAPRSRTGSGSTWPATRATWSRPRSGSASARTRGTPTAPPRPRSATSAAPTPCSGR